MRLMRSTSCWHPCKTRIRINLIQTTRGKTVALQTIAGPFSKQDAEADRWRTAFGYIGENGIKANTAYHLNGKHEFEEVE